jgi:hypothetical protein
MNRQRLHDRRGHWLVEFEHVGVRFVGGYGTFDGKPGGRLAEVFLNAPGKVGTGLDCAARDSAIVASLAMQFGCPTEILARALMRDCNGAASGPLGRLLDILAAERTP